MNIPLQLFLDADLRESQNSRKPRGDYWYSSEIGYCPRKAFFARAGMQGKEKDARTLRVFELGKIHESFLLDKVRAGQEVNGLKVIEAKREVECNNDKLKVHARADLVATVEAEGERWQEVVECKSQSSRSFTYMLSKKQGASEHHIAQLWFYLYSLNIEKGQLIYSSKDDLREAQFPVNLSNEKVAEEVLGKINFLNQNWEDKKLPEAKENWLCKYCDYAEVCPKIKNFKEINL
jgi:CRISPR/Cas system-associated exonuclease Cas4 (RecB family)